MWNTCFCECQLKGLFQGAVYATLAIFLLATVMAFSRTFLEKMRQ